MATTVDERIAALEARLDQMQKLLEERLPASGTRETKDKRGWQAIVGTFADDPLYNKAMQAGRKWRESQHERDAINEHDSATR